MSSPPGNIPRFRRLRRKPDSQGRVPLSIGTSYPENASPIFVTEDVLSFENRDLPDPPPPNPPPPPPPPPPPNPTISVSPTSATVTANGAQQAFTATVTNGSGLITWSLSPAGIGALTSLNGATTNYVPPSSIASSTVVTIQATLSTPNISASASITVNPAGGGPPSRPSMASLTLWWRADNWGTDTLSSVVASPHQMIVAPSTQYFGNTDQDAFPTALNAAGKTPIRYVDVALIRTIDAFYTNSKWDQLNNAGCLRTQVSPGIWQIDFREFQNPTGPRTKIDLWLNLILIPFALECIAKGYKGLWLDDPSFWFIYNGLDTGFSEAFPISGTSDWSMVEWKFKAPSYIFRALRQAVGENFLLMANMDDFHMRYHLSNRNPLEELNVPTTGDVLGAIGPTDPGRELDALMALDAVVAEQPYYTHNRSYYGEPGPVEKGKRLVYWAKKGVGLNKIQRVLGLDYTDNATDAADALAKQGGDNFIKCVQKSSGLSWV